MPPAGPSNEKKHEKRAITRVTAPPHSTPLNGCIIPPCRDRCKPKTHEFRIFRWPPSPSACRDKSKLYRYLQEIRLQATSERADITPKPPLRQRWRPHDRPSAPQDRFASDFIQLYGLSCTISVVCQTLMRWTVQECRALRLQWQISESRMSTLNRAALSEPIVILRRAESHR